MTLIILRASVNLLNERFATVFATNTVDSDAWDFIGEGFVFWACRSTPRCCWSCLSSAMCC